jgi:integrase
MGLGGLSSVSLSTARERAGEARRLLASKRNPIDARRHAEAARQSATTFGALADALVEDLQHGWRSKSNKASWSKTIATHAAALRDLPVDEIHTAHVLAVLTPIWQTRSETASRLRGRIERVLDAAKAKGLRSGENPARWRGHLDKLLPRRQKLAKGHHAALPYPDVPAFVAELRKREGSVPLALEFIILNASRAGEVFGARWSEIDRKAGLWTIPAARMKAGQEHRVPLSARALEILDTVEPLRTGEYIFPGKARGRPLSPASLRALLTRMGMKATTVHGFRSSFRDWAGETTSFPREIAEAALAHVVGDAVERAYRRGDALEKRRKLMDAWAGFIGSSGDRGKVIELGKHRA